MYVYKALDHGVFEADIKEEKWVTGTELIVGEFKTNEDFEEEIYDSHDWNELLDIKPLVDLMEGESLSNDNHVLVDGHPPNQSHPAWAISGSHRSMTV